MRGTQGGQDSCGCSPGKQTSLWSFTPDSSPPYRTVPQKEPRAHVLTDFATSRSATCRAFSSTIGVGGGMCCKQAKEACLHFAIGNPFNMRLSMQPSFLCKPSIKLLNGRTASAGMFLHRAPEQPQVQEEG